MREHRSSNAGEPNVPTTNQGGRVKHSIGNLTLNVDTSSLQEAVDDLKWQMKPPIGMIPLSIGGKIRFKGDKTVTREYELYVSRSIHKALRDEFG